MNYKETPKNTIQSKQVPGSELQSRMERFRRKMDEQDPSWELTVVFSKLNLYYFTGTMQEGMLLIPRNGEAILWIRRSFDRAVDESLFPVIKPMDSFRDAAGSIAKMPEYVHMETEFVSLAMIKRFQKYFPFQDVRPVDQAIAEIKAVKSEWELALMREAGRIHQLVLEEKVPHILREGMSELEFGLELYTMMVKEGHQGISRFGMFDTELILGHIAFGESSIYPTSFNGPGGNYGMGAAVPSLGSRDRKLRKGDLVFVDVGCGFQGYHSDKTVTYMFGKKPDQHVLDEHLKCVDIQNRIAEMLKPGVTPSSIYNTIMDNLDPAFLENFMGFGKRQVKFLGHGIGLTIDEWPVIANGFDKPLTEGMAMAVEPKKGIQGVGMVGIENTFLITPKGGVCITGSNPGLIMVD